MNDINAKRKEAMYFKLHSILFIFSAVQSFPQRVRRQYNWQTSPYFNGAQYWENGEQQWGNGYGLYRQSAQPHHPQQQYNQDYQNPYYAYPSVVHYSNYNSATWNTPNNNQDSYVTPPSFLSSSFPHVITTQFTQVPTNSYFRPKYLATMQPKQTIPVVVERTTLFANSPSSTTILPIVENTSHPTFIERVLKSGAGLPNLSTIYDPDNELVKDKTEGNVIPSRPSTVNTAKKEEFEEVLQVSSTSPPISQSEIESFETEPSAEIETSSVRTAESRNDTNLVLTSKPEDPIATTLIATQQISEATTLGLNADDYDLNKNVTVDNFSGDEIDEDNVDENEDEGSGRINENKSEIIFGLVPDELIETTNSTNTFSIDENESINNSTNAMNSTFTENDQSKFVDGIIGLRAPPMPKSPNSDNNGIEVVKWTDSNNFTKKL